MVSPSTTRSDRARARSVVASGSPRPRRTSTATTARRRTRAAIRRICAQTRTARRGRVGARGAESSRSLRWDDAVLHMAETERRRPKLKDLPGGQVTELIVIVVMALAIALAVQWLLVKPYRIPSGSMEPTLDVGQRVLVNRLSHRLGADPKVGDIITFHPPAGADETPPRCGAQQADDQPCPGADARAVLADLHQARRRGRRRPASRCATGTSYATGRCRTESFIAPCAGGQGCDLPRAITVPKGYVFCHGRQPRRIRRRALLGPDPDRRG